jgi:hypothetical protein
MAKHVEVEQQNRFVNNLNFNAIQLLNFRMAKNENDAGKFRAETSIEKRSWIPGLLNTQIFECKTFNTA